MAMYSKCLFFPKLSNQDWRNTRYKKRAITRWERDNEKKPKGWEEGNGLQKINDSKVFRNGWVKKSMIVQWMSSLDEGEITTQGRFF